MSSLEHSGHQRGIKQHRVYLQHFKAEKASKGSLGNVCQAVSCKTPAKWGEGKGVNTLLSLSLHVELIWLLTECNTAAG